ncbi:DUF2339 domain-containing protein [Lysinibacillus sp. 54212]|uniref:DUF2339 domain-containing protein n=1 Tax=Lysinibacillus sp. 54212 TaxID=3119829 RepID=UPI002FCAB7E9
MDRELEQRVERLEEEVRGLREELSQLKNEAYLTAVESSEIKSQISEQTKAIYKKPTPSQRKSKASPITISNEPSPENIETAQEPQRSLEETITWALPKVFMVILVLGVLWGLKLISDYGYLSDSVKIALAYLLSIGLIALPYVLEKKKKSSQAVIISLYGGAFIIGILTTAAGTILYDVLHLNLALFLALLYIAYGIFISYAKANEVLTIFVVFTSLLLPYLLEYMDFSGLLIIQFVVLLFAAVQFVVVKHCQQVALHVTTGFTHLSALALWWLSEGADMYFAIGIVLLISVYLYSWWKVYNPNSKWSQTHEGLLFSYNVFALFSLLLISLNMAFDTVVFLLSLAIYSGVAYIAYKEQRTRVLDVTGTVAFLAFIFALVTLDLSNEVQILLFGFVSFAGIMLGLRLRASIMKVSYSLQFFFITVITIVVCEVYPFFTIEHLSLAMIFVYLVIIYMYVKRPKQNLNRFESWMKKMHVQDILPILILVYFLIYCIALEFDYISNVTNYPYLTYIVILLLLLVSLFTPEKWIGKFLPGALLVGSIGSLISLLLTGYYEDANWQLNFLAKVVYSVVIIALLADLYRKGFLNKKWAAFLQKIELFINTGFVLIILLMMSILSVMRLNGWIDYSVGVIGNTITIFSAASVALLAGAKRSWQDVKILGFTLLGIGIFKLIFFDLSALDLLIRSALFIVVGGVGLLLSNRLLRK